MKNLKKLLPIQLSRPPIYGKKSLLFAFEFALVLSESAKDMGVKITPEISARAEEVIINELRINGLRKSSLNFIPLVLAVLEA